MDSSVGGTREVLQIESKPYRKGMPPHLSHYFSRYTASVGPRINIPLGALGGNASYTTGLTSVMMVDMSVVSLS